MTAAADGSHCRRRSRRPPPPIVAAALATMQPAVAAPRTPPLSLEDRDCDAEKHTETRRQSFRRAAAAAFLQPP